ncbi:hypothetical protein AC1031_005364 [Aphanomyces cochlioides]|nr:hypothetical protein AC1031_005364 [Aphanomyces cochlioides]
MDRKGKDDRLNVKEILEDMIASTKKLDSMMNSLCSNQEDDGSTPFSRHGAPVTTEELNQRQQEYRELPVDRYFERMKKDLHGRPIDGFKLPLQLLKNQPISLDNIGELRGNDKISYRVNQTPLPPCSSLNQLLDILTSRVHKADCTLVSTDAQDMAQLLVFLAQDANEYIVQAGQIFFPSSSVSVEWKTGTIIANITVDVRLHGNTWGLGAIMELEAILRGRVNNELSPAVRARYICEFHRCVASSPDSSEGRYVITDHYVLLAESSSLRMPLAATVRALQPQVKSGLVDVVNLHELNPPLLFSSPFGRSRIVSCACSPFHSLFLSDIGAVFAMGQSLDGALGLGPQITECSSPQLIDLNAQIAAGGDTASVHSMAVTADGQVYTWGARLACGTEGPPQCDRPQLVTIIENEDEEVKCIQVAAGGSFSMALTEDGQVYSWGRYLNGRLGLGNPPKRLPTARGVRNDQQLQRFPKLITDLVGVIKISAGAAHAGCVTSQGQLWCWGKNSHGQLGTGHLIDQMIPVIVALPRESELRAQAVTCGRDFTVALDNEGSVWSWGAGLTTIHPTAKGNDSSELPEWVWLRPSRVVALGSRVQSISTGRAHAGAVTVSGDAFVWGRMPAGELKLLPELVSRDCAVESLCCEETGNWGLLSGSFLSRAMYDLLRNHWCSDLSIIASGKRIQAHQMIVSYRCPTLRDMIVDEYRDSHAGEVEIILPTIRYDVCLLVLEYLYTDTLYSPVDPASCIPHDLCRASQELDLPQLEALCSKYVISEGENIASKEVSSTLCQNLEDAVGSSLYSDVMLVADSQSIHAHKCILVGRSDYFRALFCTNMREASWQTLEVDVSYATMQRVLACMYCDSWVPPESGSDLLDLLVAADKYGIHRLKVLCEVHAELTLENCMEILVLADMIHAPLLHEKAITFILNHLHVLAEAPSFIQLAKEYPSLMHEIIHHPSKNKERMLWRDWESQDSVPKKNDNEPPPSFPLIPFVFLIAFGISYLHVSAQMPQLGSYVPTINAIALIALCMYSYRELITV